LVPDLAVGVAETGEGAEALGVGERMARPFHGFRLLEIGLTAGGLAAIEVMPQVGAVAEGLGAGMAAAAEGVSLLQVVDVTLLPGFGTALGIGLDRLLGERQAAGDDVGAVFRDQHVCSVFLLVRHRLSPYAPW